jgi:hypothetical protein
LPGLPVSGVDCEMAGRMKKVHQTWRALGNAREPPARYR